MSNIQNYERKNKRNSKKTIPLPRTPIKEKIGEPITNLHDFMKLTKVKKSIVWNNKIILSACVILNWSLTIIIRQIEEKRFKYYNTKIENI